jgi:hypothetical protein
VCAWAQKTGGWGTHPPIIMVVREDEERRVMGRGEEWSLNINRRPWMYLLVYRNCRKDLIYNGQIAWIYSALPTRRGVSAKLIALLQHFLLNKIRSYPAESCGHARAKKQQLFLFKGIISQTACGCLHFDSSQLSLNASSTGLPFSSCFGDSNSSNSHCIAAKEDALIF